MINFWPFIAAAYALTIFLLGLEIKNQIISFLGMIGVVLGLVGGIMQFL